MESMQCNEFMAAFQQVVLKARQRITPGERLEGVRAAKGAENEKGNAAEWNPSGYNNGINSSLTTESVEAGSGEALSGTIMPPGGQNTYRVRYAYVTEGEQRTSIV